MKNFFRRMKQKIRFFFQRLTRGWDDSELWNLDHNLSKLILPRLKIFRQFHLTYPHGMEYEEFNAIVDKMIYSFEYLSTDKAYDFNPEEDKKVQEGLELFAKYFRALWD